jgi:hypothetical protein
MVPSESLCGSEEEESGSFFGLAGKKWGGYES